MGAGFAVMLFFLTPAVLVEQIASTRTMLPLALAFNLCLAEQRGAVFWCFFVAGNAGLLWCFHDMLPWCTLPTPAA